MYISAGSSDDKLRETFADVSEAVEENIVSDATSRNALYKIHVSLGKIVNALEAQQQQPTTASSIGRATSMGTDMQDIEEVSTKDNSVVVSKAEEAEIEEEDDDDDDDDDEDASEGTVVPKKEEVDDEDELSMTEAGNDTAIGDS